MTKVRLCLPGEKKSDATVSSQVQEYLAEIHAEVHAHTQVSVARRSLAPQQNVIVEADESDVLQLTWGDDVVELVRVSDLPERFPDPARRSHAGGFQLPIWQPLGELVRGEDGLPLRSVEHLALGAAEIVVDSFLPPAVSALESKFMPRPGVFRVGPDGKLSEEVEEATLSSGGPILALIHGTFSNTRAAFEKLFLSKEWRDLYARYSAKGSVIALEQHTVGVSPIEHALQLARVIPEGATLDVISHSRGGLVGDILARYPWEKEAIEHFFRKDEGDDRYARIREQLAELASVLEQKPVRIARFVRVAAPAAGTLLASNRLDTYLSVILSVLGKVAGQSAPWFAFLKAIATTIVHARTRVDVCPGLEAMMPHLDRGLVPFLNAVQTRNERPGEELAIVAGDVEGGNVFDRIKAFFADLYFQEANDFVVDSESMFRGVPRSSTVAIYHRGPEASHFTYFASEPLRKDMSVWLRREAGHSFRPLEEVTVEGEERGAVFGFGTLEQEALTARPNSPLVLLLPGIMGSHLQRGDKRLWVDMWQLALGGMNKLRWGAPDIEPAGVVRGYYKALAKSANERNDVRIFPFDWRRSILDLAEDLKKEILRELPSQRPIRLLAHSMGGLVSRTFIWKNPELWNEIVARGGRLVMLGTPNFGSYVPAQVYAMQHKLMRMLAAVDTSNNLGQLTEVIREFPGLLQMLPYRGEHDLLSFESWDRFTNYRPAAGALAKALDLRRELDRSAIDPASMVYVAGQADKTPIAMALRDGRVSFRMSPEGDGTVPWTLGRLPGVDTYYVPAEHGDLPAHKEAFAGYLELLARGTTHLLPRAPSHRRRDGIDVGEETWESLPLEQEAVRYYPSEADLLATLMGSSRGKRKLSVIPVEVEVINGHLQHARHPLVVGHYNGDAILSAEKIIDAHLEGRLSRDHKLELYPGPLNTSRIFLDPDDNLGARFPGAIVVGLGEVGVLSRQTLQTTLATALLEYALGRLSCHQKPEALELTFSSLLIGTWGTRLTLEDAMEALLGATLTANERLSAQALSVPVRFKRVRIFELYKEEASEAARAALRIEQRKRGLLSVSKFVIEGKSARVARPVSPYATGWQRRVGVRMDKRNENRILFDIMTESARSDERQRFIQWEHVKPLLATAPDGDREASAVLFQYLVPTELAGLLEQGGDIVLSLDRQTAQVPWELLGPRDTGQQPAGVRLGIVRSLAVADPPRVHRATGRKALVVGNPAGSHPPLKGAAAEAEHVANALTERGMDVSLYVESSADDIFRALYRQEYDIIHIAAHGELLPRNPDAEENEHPTSAVVLENGRRLTASEFENLKAVPSVVFLNCCHLGAMGEMRLSQPGEWAASLAEQLIRMGVGIVVVAGWAVGDASAKTFAEELYAALLDGRNLMSAVRIARAAAYAGCPISDLTWGAYQVYGSPGFVLRSSPNRPMGGPSSLVCVVPSELEDSLADIAARANMDPFEVLSAELESCRETLLAEWEDLPSIQAALGSAYFSLAEYERAIEFWKRCLPSSVIPLSVPEQLSSAEARLAETCVMQDSRRAAALFDSSIQRLTAVLQIQRSPERHALLGSIYRRKAKCHMDVDVSLSQAAAQYAAAAALPGSGRYHHLTTSQALNLCRGVNYVDRVVLEEARMAVQEARENDEGAALGLVDIVRIEKAVELFQEEADGSPSDEPLLTTTQTMAAEAIAAAYVEVLRRGPQSQRDSVVDDLSTTVQLCGSPDLKMWMDLLQQRLREHLFGS